MSKVIYARDHGVLPDRYINSLGAINKMIESVECGDEEVIIKFDTGKYTLSYEECIKREIYITNTSSEKEVKSKVKNIGIFFENKKNVTFDGNGSFFAVNGEMIIIALENSENISFRNFSSDYTRATVSEMKIERVNLSGISLGINKDSAYTLGDNKIRFKGANFEYAGDETVAQVCDNNGGRTWRVSTPLKALKMNELSPFSVKLSGHVLNPKDKIKEGYTYQVRKPQRTQVGVFIRNSKNVSFEEVNFHYMHGLGIVGEFSEDLYFDSVKCCPRPETGRTCAAFADIMHFTGCSGKITVKNSYLSNSNDDAINVHGIHMLIKEKVSDRRVLVEFMHPQTYGFEAFKAGDDVEGVDVPTLNLVWANKVKEARLIDKYKMLLEFETAYDGIKVGQAIENITATPEVEITGNTFEHIPTRGILVTTRRKVVIRKNTFNKTGMSAILIADDAKSWYESGRVMDVTIDNNVFDRCSFCSKDAVILIQPENSVINLKTPVHKGIKITNNKFILDKTVAISAKSSTDIKIRGNRYEGNTGPRPVYSFIASSGVVIEDEEHIMPKSRMSLILMDKKDVERR